MRTCHTCKAVTVSAVASGWIETSKPDERKHKYQCLKCTDRINPSAGTIAAFTMKTD